MQKYFQKFVRLLNRKTLYPFILNDWNKIEEPHVIGEVINLGYFRKNLKPYEPNLKGIKNIVVIAPHQDDEAIGCGGLLLKLKDQSNITVIYVTNGEQSNMGIGKKESVELRNSEAISALKLINAKAVFLDIPNEDLKISEDEVSMLSSELSKYKPDLILSPWLFDRPYKHRIVNYILFKSLMRISIHGSTPIWNYQVHNVVYPNVVIDITENIHLKKKMINEYSSQITGNSPYDHYTLGMNQWNSQYLPKKRGYAEIYYAIPISEYINVFNKIIKPKLSIYIDK